MTTQSQQRRAPAPSTALAIIDPREVPLAVQLVGEDRLDLLAEQVGRGWKVAPTPAELEVIALICKENRWNIFARPAQVHFVKRWDTRLGKEVMTPQTSIDGMRLAASRSRNYIGPAGYQWCGDDGVWKDVWLQRDPPRAARAGAFVRGSREPLYAVALWDEWAQWQDETVWNEQQHKNVKTGQRVLGSFWASKPAHMLAKTAETMIIKQVAPAETDELELAHLDELDRLEAPVLARRYDEIYGADEGHAFAELPVGAGAPSYVPTRERDIEDQPRPPAAPPRSPSDKHAALMEMYAELLAQAKRDGVIDDEAPWALRADAPDVQIISEGRKLRGLVNQATIARASQNQPATSDPEPEGAQQQDEPIPEVTAPSQPSPPRKVEMVGVRSPLYDRMSELVEAAAQLDVPFDEYTVTWPAPKEEVLRKIERLEEAVRIEKDRLTGARQSAESEEEQSRAF